MIALTVTIAMGAPAPAPAPQVWRIVNRPGLHVGLRPAAFVSRDESAIGATLQVTL